MNGRLFLLLAFGCATTLLSVSGCSSKEEPIKPTAEMMDKIRSSSRGEMPPEARKAMEKAMKERGNGVGVPPKQ